MKEIRIGWRIGGNHGDSTGGPRDVGYRPRPGESQANFNYCGSPRISTIGFCQDRGRFCAAWFWRFCCFAVKVGGLGQTQPSGAGRAEGRMDWSAGGVPPQGGLRLDLCVSAVCWLESRGHREGGHDGLRPRRDAPRTVRSTRQADRQTHPCPLPSLRQHALSSTIQ